MIRMSSLLASGLLAASALSVIGCYEYDPDLDGTQPPENASGETDEFPWDAEASVCSNAPTERYTVTLRRDGSSQSTGSPAWVRQLITEGKAVPTAAQRQDFINHFSFGFPQPESTSLRLTAELGTTAETSGFVLLVGLTSPQASALVPLHLTFLVETSLSMEGYAMDMAQASLKAVAASLLPGDTVSLITTEPGATPLLSQLAVNGANDERLLEAALSLEAGGSSDFPEALAKAYALADVSQAAGEISSLVVISDGGFWLEDADRDRVAQEAQAGVRLAGVGVSSSPELYDVSALSALASIGRGPSTYVDSENEAQALFSREGLERLFHVVAEDITLKIGLPGGFEVNAFSGETLSLEEPSEEPQRLGSLDELVYRLNVTDCQAVRTAYETYDFVLTYTDPLTGKKETVAQSVTLEDLLAGASSRVTKYDALRVYAHVLDAVWEETPEHRSVYLTRAKDYVVAAIPPTGDPELQEVVAQLTSYLELFVASPSAP